MEENYNNTNAYGDSGAAPQPPVTEKKGQSIAKINREARNAGMTYGKYVALND